MGKRFCKLKAVYVSDNQKTTHIYKKCIHTYRNTNRYVKAQEVKNLNSEMVAKQQ